ncbi:peptidylprolyl isomerase [Streptomyces sp. NPDC005808]|uniref:peptidylprolyl isomerase n=1 Tax=Streptomyces sp. NPDC005808 TaxID=3364734 RepID=UPI0036C1443F
MAFAVTGIGSALTWISVSLTAEGSDSKPRATCSYTPTERGKPSGTSGTSGTPGTSDTPGTPGTPSTPSTPVIPVIPVIPVFDAEKAARPLTATLVTNRGEITLKALTGDAPCTTNSFSFLARKGYFDGSECHRVTTRGIYVLECGDTKGDGKADPGYFFPDENLDGADYPAGTVAMAKAAPGRNGSQFFISYADPDVGLPSQWTPFAKVVGGTDVLQEIGMAGTSDGSTDGRPRKPVVIESVVLR